MRKQRTKTIVKYQPHNLPTDKTDWKRVDAMTDQELQNNAQSDPDTLFADTAFWQHATLIMPTTIGKERITIRLDADVLNWLKEQGKGYQSRINAILRSCMMAMKKTSRDKS